MVAFPCQLRISFILVPRELKAVMSHDGRSSYSGHYKAKFTLFNSI